MITPSAPFVVPGIVHGDVVVGGSCCPHYPVVTHARGFVAHLVFGLVVAATFEVGWVIARRRP
ncbi:MAG: hypothetical protein KY439_05370 [Actinobacteria bacterium]|nr:hypothetical protein [Actinomycetota bacterium]